MTSPLLRLFAVFWWLVVIGSAVCALVGVWLVREDYAKAIRDTVNLILFSPPNVSVPEPDPTGYILVGAMIFLGSLLPYVALTITRWIITARWRFGPRW